MWFIETPKQAEVARLDESLLEKVQDLYQRLSVDRGKPLLTVGGCEDVAAELEKIGLKRVRGEFRIDRSRGMPMPGYHIGHDWGEDSQGTIVELNKSLNQHLIEPFPDGVVLIRPSDPRHHRYIYPKNNQGILKAAASLVLRR